MICFEVRRNGMKIRTAGVEKGMLVFHLTHLTGRRKTPELLSFSIAGLACKNIDDTGAHVSWILKDAKIGDRFEIAIVERDTCDRPVRQSPPKARKRRRAAG
jgi:hypothetical protein